MEHLDQQFWSLISLIVSGLAALVTMLLMSRIANIEKRLSEALSKEMFFQHLDEDRRAHESMTKGQKDLWDEINKMREAMTKGFNDLQQAYFDGERRRFSGDRNQRERGTGL